MIPPLGEAPPRAAAMPLSRRLKDGTRDVHEDVETAASFNRLIVVRIPAPVAGAPADVRAHHDRARTEYLEVYRRFLVASYGFEAAVDAALAASPTLGVAARSGYPTEPAMPTTLIRDDLEQVFGAAATGTLEPMAPLAPPRTLAEFAGTEYVRRGSRAGGVVIAAVVQHNLALTRETGAAFLMQYGKQTRRVLATFQGWVDGLELSEADMQAAVDAAIATFRAVRDWHLRLDARFAAS